MGTQTSTLVGTKTYVKTLAMVAIGAAAFAAAAGVIKVIVGEKGQPTKYCLEQPSLSEPSLGGGLEQPALQDSNCVSLLDVIFSDVRIEVTDTNATIMWKTSKPVTSRLSYSKESAGWSNTEFALGYPLQQTDHRVDIKNLTPKTIYTYTLFAETMPLSATGQVSGMLTAAAQLSHPSFRFTTKPLDVSYSSVQIQATDTSATVAWQTSKPVIGRLYFESTDKQIASNVYVDSSPTTNHYATIANIRANTAYTFTLSGFDPVTRMDSLSSDPTYRFTTQATVIPERMIISSPAPAPAPTPAPAPAKRGRGASGRGSGVVGY